MRHNLALGQVPPGLPPFEGFDFCQPECVLSCFDAAYMTYEDGDVVSIDGSLDGVAVYLIRGRVDGCTYDGKGNRSILHTFLPGRLVACRGVSGMVQPSFAIVARGGCLLAVMRHDCPLHPCEKAVRCTAAVARSLAKAAAGLEADLMTALDIRTRRSARGKILAFLEYEACRQGSSTVQVAFTRQELADYLCMDRVTLSRELKTLRDEGQFDFDRSRFDLHLRPPKVHDRPGRH